MRLAVPLSFQQKPVAFFLYEESFYRGVELRAFSRGQLEAPGVQGAGDATVLQVAFGKGCSRVGAGVVDGVEGAFRVPENGDGFALHLVGPALAGGEVSGGAEVMCVRHRAEASGNAAKKRGFVPPERLDQSGCAEKRAGPIYAILRECFELLMNLVGAFEAIF